MELDPKLVKRIKELNLKLSDKPQPELLIRIPNRFRELDYDIDIDTDEFTSLCPLNISQPDYATIRIHYVPDEWCIELKSLKFYLTSFRTVAIFHEEVPNVILGNLMDLISPKYIKVEGDFTVRGGLHTTVKADWIKRE